MRLIDADEIKYREQLEWFGNGRYEPMQFVYESDIDIQPTVDAVPVIRCKDCKYYREGECWCEHDNDGWKYYQSVIENPLPDDFCSRAERAERKEE